MHHTVDQWHGHITKQYGAIKIKYNICCIKPYKFDAKVEDSSSKNISDDVNI